MEAGNETDMSQKILGQRQCFLHPDEPMRIHKVGGRIEWHCIICDKKKAEVRRREKIRVMKEQGKLL